MDSDKSGPSSQFTGKFCWEEIEGVAVPFIIRGSGEMLAEITMLKKTAFKKHLEVLSEEVFQMACPSNLMNRPRKHRATKLELKLLNEINAVHCDYYFSKNPIVSSTFLLGMGDAVQLFQLLEVFYKVATEGKIENPRCGYILIDESNTPIPFVDVQNIGIVVPLFFFECPAVVDLLPELEDHWPLTYLKLFCKLLCIQRSFYDLWSLKVVRLNYLKDVIPEASQFTFITTLPGNAKIGELTKSKILPQTFKNVTEKTNKLNKSAQNVSNQLDEVIIIDDNDEEVDERVASKKTVPSILKSKHPVLLKCLRNDPQKSRNSTTLHEAEKAAVETTSSPTLTPGGSSSPQTRNGSRAASKFTKFALKKTSRAIPEPQQVCNEATIAVQPVPESSKLCKEATIERTPLQCKTCHQHIKPQNTSITSSPNLESAEEAFVDQNLNNKKISRVVPRFTKIAPKSHFIVTQFMPELENVSGKIETTCETCHQQIPLSQKNLSTTPASNLASPSTASTSSSASTVVEQNSCNISISSTSNIVGGANKPPIYTLTSGGFFIQQNLSDNSQTSIPSTTITSLSTSLTTSSAPPLLNTSPATFLLASGGSFIQANLSNYSSATSSLTSEAPIAATSHQQIPSSQENLPTTSASNLVSPSTASSSAPTMIDQNSSDISISSSSDIVGAASTPSIYSLTSGGFFIQQNSQISIPSSSITSLSTASTTSFAPAMLNTPPATFLLASGGGFIQANLSNSSATSSLTSPTPIMSSISHPTLLLPSGASLIQSNLSSTLQTSSLQAYNVADSSTASTTSSTPIDSFTQPTASNLLVTSSTLSLTSESLSVSLNTSNSTKNPVLQQSLSKTSIVQSSSTVSASCPSPAGSNIAAPTVTLTPEGLLIQNSSNSSLLQCSPYSYNMLPPQLGLQVVQPSGLVAQSSGLGMSQGMALQPPAGAVEQRQQTQTAVQQASLGANAANSFIILQQQNKNADAQSSIVGTTGNSRKLQGSLLQPRLTVLQNSEDVIVVDEPSKNQKQPKALLQAPPPLSGKQQQPPSWKNTPFKVACQKRKRPTDVPVKLTKKPKKMIVVSKSGTREALYKVNEIPQPTTNLTPSSCYRIERKNLAGRDFVCINILPTRASEMLINILEIREKLFAKMDKETFMTIAFQMKLEIFSLNSMQKASLEAYYTKVKEPIVKEYLYFYFIKFFYVYDDMKKFVKMK